MSRGLTLLELIIVVMIVGVVAAIISPSLARQIDRMAVRRAVVEVSATYRSARLWAVYHRSRVRLEFSGSTLRGVAEGSADSVFLQAPGPARYGVQMKTSRPVIRIGPTGVGWGAANTKIVLERGVAAESLATSRVGRLRRYP